MRFLSLVVFALSACLSCAADGILLTFPPSADEAGSFNVVHGTFGNPNHARDNDVWRFGYNIGNGGSLAKQGEPALALEFENFYDAPGQGPLLEFHLTYVNTQSQHHRIFSCTANRTTDQIIASMRFDKLSWFDGSGSNQWMYWIPGPTSAALGMNPGTRIIHSANNQDWLKQLNASRTSFVELARVDAYDDVLLAPSSAANECGAASWLFKVRARGSEPAGESDSVVLWAKNVGGKMKLMAKFPSGKSKEIAGED